MRRLLHCQQYCLAALPVGECTSVAQKHCWVDRLAPSCFDSASKSDAQRLLRIFMIALTDERTSGQTLSLAMELLIKSDCESPTKSSHGESKHIL